MNSLKCAATVAAMLVGNVWATNADAMTYAKISVGQSGAEIEGINLTDGDAYGAALGANLGPVRVEVGVDRLAGALNAFGPSIEANALDYHATAYLDLPVGDNAKAFAGVGLDYIDGQAGFFGTDIDASGDGWHWAAGASYRLSESITAEAQFRQVSASLDADFLGDVDLDASEVTLGLRFAL